MNPELQQKIIKECPLLFGDYGKPITETCISWGIDTGSGWFDIIYSLSKKLEKIISEMPKEEQSYCRASQIKEKFGTLRFYITCENNKITKLISEAEKKSGKICEVCGSKAVLCVRGSWFKVLCSKCMTENGYNIYE